MTGAFYYNMGQAWQGILTTPGSYLKLAAQAAIPDPEGIKGPE